jgi:hypothetical protein
MATVKSSAENLTLNADGSGNDILFQSNGTQVGSLTAEGVFTATSFAGSGAALTGLSSFDPDGAVTINDTGADVDFRVESDTNANALFVQGSDGFVGIGTGSPSASLEIAGTYSNTVNTNISLKMGERWGFRVSTSGEDEDLHLDGNLSGTPFVSMTWDKLTKDVIVKGGDLIFGTAGKGVVLGATSNTDANTLDDYEEGTFTPTISGTNSCSMGDIYANSYTKVGNKVTLYATFTVTSSASPATGALIFGGLPFAFKSFADGMFLIGVHYNYRETPMAFMNVNGNTYYQNTTVGGNNLGDLTAGLDSLSNFTLNFTYLTNA